MALTPGGLPWKHLARKLGEAQISVQTPEDIRKREQEIYAAKKLLHTISLSEIDSAIYAIWKHSQFLNYSARPDYDLLTAVLLPIIDIVGD